MENYLDSDMSEELSRCRRQLNMSPGDIKSWERDSIVRLHNTLYEQVRMVHEYLDLEK